MWKGRKSSYKVVSQIPDTSERQKFKNTITEKLVKSAVVWVGIAALFAVFSKGVPKMTSVSSTVNGRELPIYCVETAENKVALSFDAAWGNEDTAQILEILEKHDVHATFFMTGGWVGEYTY